MRRRRFLEGGLAVAFFPGLESVLPRVGSAASPSPLTRFTSIAPSTADALLLPEGFRHDVVIRWGDRFTRDGRNWGYNNDWVGILPLSAEEALLGVNHEYVSFASEGDAPLYPDSYRILHGRADTLEDWKREVGLSVLRVRRDSRSGVWRPVLDDPLNRRVDALTLLSVDGPAAALLGGGPIEGTFQNCSGQVTPWGTFLTCEENYQEYVPDAVDTEGHGTRGGLYGRRGSPYGWVVEVDPFDPESTPVKHTALGRFHHENVALRAEPGRPVAAYMGDDQKGGHVWKFVSDELYRPRDKQGARRLLTSGRLFAARLFEDGSGEWRPLDLKTDLHPSRDPLDPMPALRPHAQTLGDVYASFGAALVDAYRAANCIGATPSGRPEDLEIHPGDGSVYIAFTAESGREGLFENIYGEIWRFEEEGGDVSSRRFRWRRFVSGGPSDASRAGRVFAQPDNLLFDPEGNLWMCADMSASRLNLRADYLPFANNGVFLIPTSGPDAGQPRQLASVPCEAEPAGPALTPDGETLFLSIQHPGERFGIRSEAGAAPRGSNWPDGGLKTPPRPSLVAIRRS